MKKIIVSLLLLGAIAASVFAKDFKLNIVPGPSWEKRKPQCSVWIADSEGKYVATIFVTKSASKKAWIASPKEGRPDSLPVWYHAAGLDPAKPSQLELDAVTSATPKKSMTVSSSVPLEKEKKYFVYVEVNQSFDYNNLWTKANSGVNGQPSVVYVAEFNGDATDIEIEPVLIGTGSVDGKNGSINRSELFMLSSAKEIIKNIFVVIK